MLRTVYQESQTIPNGRHAWPRTFFPSLLEASSKGRTSSDFYNAFLNLCKQEFYVRASVKIGDQKDLIQSTINLTEKIREVILREEIYERTGLLLWEASALNLLKETLKRLRSTYILLRYRYGSPVDEGVTNSLFEDLEIIVDAFQPARFQYERFVKEWGRFSPNIRASTLKFAFVDLNPIMGDICFLDIPEQSDDRSAPTMAFDIIKAWETLQESTPT